MDSRPRLDIVAWRRIVAAVNAGKAPSESYTPEERAAHAACVAELARHRLVRPDAVLDVPSDD